MTSHVGIFASRPQSVVTTSTYTDFKNAYAGTTLINTYPIGSLMNDWTAIPSTGTPSAAQVVAFAGAISGQAFKYQAATSSAGSIAKILWNYVPVVQNVEVLVGFRVAQAFSSVPRSNGGSIRDNGQILTALRTDVFCSGGSSLRNLLQLEVYGSSTFEQPTASITWSLNTWYWIRLQGIGSNYKAKMWARSASEPSVWTIEYTSANNNNTGKVGFVCGERTTSESYTDWFSVSTDGTPAYGPV